MKGITAPIIAITLVLLSVFVPVAFIPVLVLHQFAVAWLRWPSGDKTA